jgi:hypothetical protein
MMALVDHRPVICSAERDVAELLAYKYYRLLNPRGLIGDIIKSHWHEHFI